MGGFRKGSEPERRVDPTDGKAYTKEEFAECYGGAKEWAAAQRVGGAAAQRGAADSKNKPGEKVDSSVSPSRAAKGSRSGDSERRVDPADGKAYLKSEFVACYGGTKEWDGARPIDRPTLQASEVHDAPESDTVEYRRDPADGRAYTKKDFVECYGGMKEWKQAERVDAREVVKDVRRIDPADGKRYTKQDFVDCYGGTNEWDRAKEAMPEVREMATKLPEQQGKGNIVNCKGSRGGKAAKSDRGAAAHSEPPSDDEISALCRQRQEARRARDFKVADAIRDKLMSLRVKINDDDRTWTAPNGHRGSWSGAGGGQKSWKKDSDKPVQSAWTAGLADGERHKAELQRKETSSRDIGWSGAEGSSVSEVFPKPSVAEKIESFLTECNTVSPLQKALVLLGLPFEIFWGVLAHSWNARHWAATEVVVLLSDASPPVQDAGVRLVARLCLHAEKVDTKFNLRSYAALFCRSDDSLFSVQTLGTLCRLGSKITLLKDAVVAVLIACHNVYYEPRSKGSGGLLNVFLEDLKAQCWDVVFSSCSDGPKSWPNDTKKIALLRDLLVNTLWPLLKTAPFLVRTLAPVLEWAKLFAVFYEVPVQVLLKKTKGNAGNDLAAAALDCMRLVLEYYPFPVIDQPDQDIGFTSVQIEAALLQGLRSFSLVSPLRMERLPPTFESLLDKTYGRDGAESFLLSEVVASLHSHTDEFRREHGNLLQAAEQGAFVEDLMCIYNLDSTILRDAAMMGKLTDDDLQTATSIAVGLLTRSPGLKPAASRPAPAAETVSPEAFVLKEIAGDAIKSLAHAQAILAYYDDNQEKALAAIFDSNLPPQLVEDTSKAAASSPSGTREPTNHRPPRRPVTALTNPERFVPIGALLKKKKPDEDAEFDELLRQRVVASQRKFEYEDEVDDSCDYMPGGALEEEKRRKQLQSMSFKKIGADSGDGPLSEAVAADCPSDEEWGGYGESDDEEEEDDTQTGQTGGKGHKGGKNGNRGDGFPRAISGESTGEKKGNSGRRRATATDQQTRNFLDKNKSRFANHNRKAQADRKRRTML